MAWTYKDGEIIGTDISILKVLKITPSNSGNVECERISSTFWGKGGKALVYIENPIVGNTYEQRSNMVRMGYGMNWKTVSTKKL